MAVVRGHNTWQITLNYNFPFLAQGQQSPAFYLQIEVTCLVVVGMRLMKEQFGKGNFKFSIMGFNGIPTYMLRAKK